MNQQPPLVILPQAGLLYSADFYSEGQCDCACPASPSEPDHRPTRVNLSSNLVQNQSLQIISLQDPKNHFAVFIPSGKFIVVVNESARSILNEFQSPASISKLQANWLNFWKETDFLLQELSRINFLINPGSVSIEQPVDKTNILSVWLHITNECNLRCHYCYLKKTNEYMDPEIGFLAIDAVVRSATANNFSKIKLKYAGGEALLKLSTIIEVQKYAQALTQSIGVALDSVVLSNGVGLSRGKIEALKDNNIRLMISLDGVGDTHDSQRQFSNGAGSFKSVSRSIDRTCLLGLVPDISITVTNRNIDNLPETLSWILDRDLPFSINWHRENEYTVSHEDLHLQESRIINGMLAAFQTIEKRLPRRSLLSSIVDRANLGVSHNHTCGAGQNYLVIDPYGNIAKCQMQIRQSVTNISHADPLSIIRSDSIGIQNIAVNEKEGCRECEWKYWCTGGCPLTTYRATGRYDIKSPNCKIYKSLFPHVVRLEGLRILKYQTR